MAEVVTIARPYAQAVFESAQAKGTVEKWYDMLRVMADIGADENIKAIVGDPSVSSRQLVEVFFECCKSELNIEGKNLIRLMADNGRLGILPQVSKIFESLKDQQEGMLEASIVSAFALDGEQLRGLITSLERKFKHRIVYQVSVDPELIGGVKVEVGDEVLDASIQGKLEAMAISLKS